MISPKPQRITLLRHDRSAFEKALPRHFRASLWACCAIALSLVASNALAQSSIPEAKPLTIRTFTNKAGLKIEAQLVAVGGSMRTISIQRPSDERRFDLEIITLSLDDQQYIKTWLHDQPTPQPDQLNLRLEGQPFLTEATREKFEDRIYGGSGTRSKFGYQFTINNLSRQPLLGCRLEYVLLIRDQVEIRASDENDETVRWRTKKNGPVIYRTSEIALEALKYNTELNVVSATVDHEEVRAGSSENYAEDEVLGVLARLVTANGSLLAEFSDIESRNSHLDWDSFAQLRDSAETDNGEGTLTEALVSR